MGKKISVVQSFPIVGIGASAGGLEAFQELLKNVSNNPRMALVFIMHLAPKYKSMLVELLARVTKMPVMEIKSGMVPEINHVYVKPPSSNLFMSKGKMILRAFEDKSVMRMPIDYFFRSLAEEFGDKSIGVVLSGTATDGTLGALAIKAAGGLTFAQDAKSAAYNNMPQSLISSGCVDFVLSPKKIAEQLERIITHPLNHYGAPAKKGEIVKTSVNSLESIFDILRRVKGVEFNLYKDATFSRRLARRIALTKQRNIKGYIKFLRENEGEATRLYEDLLINVTSFFRDKKVFNLLEKTVIPVILKNKTKDQSVRVWVPACSSGEEAYSIAMLFTEAMGKFGGTGAIQIFATDISESGIDKARRGVYGPGIKDDVSPARLRRFFKKEGDVYKISRVLREMCIFSKQNVFSDPPFSNIDLVSCRNMLIYLEPVLQKKVLHNLHYSLRPGGYLVLGNSESLAGLSKFFKDVDRKQRIFVKKYISIMPRLELDLLTNFDIKAKRDIRIEKEADVTGIVDRIILDEYAPCGVLIDSNMGVVQFRGHTGRFLESAQGKPSLDIFKLAREGLLIPLRAAIYKSRNIHGSV